MNNFYQVIYETKPGTFEIGRTFARLDAARRFTKSVRYGVSVSIYRGGAGGELVEKVNSSNK